MCRCVCVCVRRRVVILCIKKCLAISLAFLYSIQTVTTGMALGMFREGTKRVPS